MVPEDAKQVIDLADLPMRGEMTTVAERGAKPAGKSSDAMKKPAARAPIPVAHFGAQR